MKRRIKKEEGKEKGEDTWKETSSIKTSQTS